MGAAETGSGKTLAFSIPIVNYLANNPGSRGGWWVDFEPHFVIIICARMNVLYV